MKTLLTLVLVFAMATLGHADILATYVPTPITSTVSVQPVVTPVPESRKEQHIDKWGWIWIAVLFVVGSIAVYEHEAHPGVVKEAF